MPAQNPAVTKPMLGVGCGERESKKEMTQPEMETSAPWYAKMKAAPRRVVRLLIAVLSVDDEGEAGDKGTEDVPCC